MGTKLNDAELALMTKVRDKMRADWESAVDCDVEIFYICHNIVLIENGLTHFSRPLEFGDLSHKPGSLSDNLVTLINKGINEWIAFDIYLEELGIGLPWSQITAQFAQMGRLAWLDRIVETGEIG